MDLGAEKSGLEPRLHRPPRPGLWILSEAAHLKGASGFSFALSVPAGLQPTLRLFSWHIITLNSYAASLQAGFGEPVVTDFIFILRFYFIFNRYKCLHFIIFVSHKFNNRTTECNALCVLLHLKRVLYHELYFELTHLPRVRQAQAEHLPGVLGYREKETNSKIPTFIRLY